MPGEEKKGFQLENILFQLLEHQSRQEKNDEDTMLMLGLVNLFGIVSYMNKHAGEPVSSRQQGREGGMDSLLTPLIGALASQRGPAAADFPGAGGGGINPAVLMSLLASQTQRPEQAMLINLLMNMMNNQGQGQPPPPRPFPEMPRDSGLRENTFVEKRDSVENTRANRANSALKWDSRLG